MSLGNNSWVTDSETSRHRGNSESLVLLLGFAQGQPGHGDREQQRPETLSCMGIGRDWRDWTAVRAGVRYGSTTGTPMAQAISACRRS